MNTPRRDLPPLPTRMQRLPVDERGYPVPWFVTWFNEKGDVLPNGKGTPDFRVVTTGKVITAYRENACWVCGGRLGVHKSFAIGPMCAINRTTSEPPSHLECADFSARACPFLTKPHMRRRENAMPEDCFDPAGHMIRRNPGVTLVWTTRSFKPFKAPGGDGFLFEVDTPEHVRWYCQGRQATREEILHSIETGLPSLRSESRGGRVGCGRRTRTDDRPSNESRAPLRAEVGVTLFSRLVIDVLCMGVSSIASIVWFRSVMTMLASTRSIANDFRESSESHPYRSPAVMLRGQCDEERIEPFNQYPECGKCKALSSPNWGPIRYRSHLRCPVNVCHFHMRCTRCGHRWAMATADACIGEVLS